MTLKDIALLAGVSTAAVSLVINGKPGVSEAKRDEILRLLQEHEYDISRHLRPHKTIKTILLVKYCPLGHLVEDNLGFIADLISGMEMQCHAEGYALQAIHVKDTLDYAIQNYDFSGVCGVLFIGTEFDTSVESALSKVPVPYVVVDNMMPHFQCNAVTMDNYDMTYQAVKHLHDQGYTDIGFLKCHFDVPNLHERTRSFLNAVKLFDMQFDPEHEYLLGATMTEAYRNMKEYLEAGCSVPSCFFSQNDMMALGAMRALQEYGYQVPEDVAIIGFDDVRYAQVSTPPLSTIRVDTRQMGFLAVRMLVDSMEKPEMHCCKLLVGGSLIVRESTAPQSFDDIDL